MIKVWLVIMIFGKVAESIGPLPYDLDECRGRTVVMEANMDGAFADPETAGHLKLDGQMVTRKDITFACLESADRPRLGVE